MNHPKITAIIADVGGVLIRNYDQTRVDVQQRVELDDDTFESLWPSLIRQLGEGSIDEQTFWDHFNAYGANNVSVSENVLGRSFTETLIVHHNVIDAIGSLAARKAILSDTIEPHATALRAAGVYQLFEPHVYLSHETGLRKPDVNAYQHVIDSLKIAPNETLFVDDREINLVEPRKLGMHVIQSFTPEQTIAEIHSYFS